MILYFDRFGVKIAWVASALLAATGLMLTFEVASRYCFDITICGQILGLRPTIWAMELSQFCLIWGSLLPMAWLLHVRRHIAVDAVIDLLPEGARRVVEATAMLIVAVFSIVVTLYGWDICWDSFISGRTTGTILDMPSWWVEAAIPLGFALLFAQSLIEAIRCFRGEIIEFERVLE